MELLPIIYLGYMFVSIYFLSFFLLIFFNNRKRLFEVPKLTKKYSLTVLVPAFNEEKTIQDTIKTVIGSGYPIEKLIVLNDGSSDDTGKMAEKLKSKYPQLVVVNKKNSGKADCLNEGLKMVDTELVAVVDADSYPEKGAIEKLIGFFDDKKVAVSTPFIVPRNRKKFFEQIQVIEYNIIAFTRKLLGFVDAIYVTPGPLAIYRTSVLKGIGGFDTENMTEDIEATWHITKEGHKREMCLDARATTTTPSKLIPWFKQRRRWNLGGLQCIMKYKKYFLKKGMLGLFILPFFVLQLFLGLVGLGIFIYLLSSRLLNKILFLTTSINIGSPLLTSDSFLITPSFLNYLGLILFLFGFTFTIIILYVMKETILSKQNLFNIVFYSIIYLSAYPFIMLNSMYHYARGIRKWR